MNFKFRKSDLNFRVFAATETPTTGKENDICIISDTPIKNWILSPDAPSGAPRTNGNAWLQYSVDGAVFDAIKSNAMMIALRKAWQYVGGEWLNVTALIYHGGEWEWLNMDGQLYNRGDECESITGGWESANKCLSTYSALPVTFGDSISYRFTAADNQSFACTKNKISFKAGDKIRVNGEQFTGRLQIFVVSDNAVGWDSKALARYLASDLTASQHDLAITNDMSGYLIVGAHGGSSVPTGSGIINSVRIVRA